MIYIVGIVAFLLGVAAGIWFLITKFIPWWMVTFPDKARFQLERLLRVVELAERVVK